MKLTNLQKHYQRTFNDRRQYVLPGTPVTYKVIGKYNYKKYNKYKNKKAQQYAKYLGTNIILGINDNNDTPGLYTKNLYVLEVLVHINNIPCTIAFGTNKFTTLYMGYNTNNNNHDLYSTDNNISVLNCKLVSHSSNNTPLFRNNMYNHESGEMINESELNGIMSSYNITDKEIPEEQLFQFSTVSDTLQYYIAVYQRMYHVLQRLHQNPNPNPSVLELLRYAAGL